MFGGVQDAVDAPADNVAAVPVSPLNSYVMVCVKDDDAAVTVNVPALPIVKDGTVIVDALGIVVSARVPFSPLGILILPGRNACDDGVDIVAHTVIVLVPSLLCGTVTVPEQTVYVDVPPDGDGIEICSSLSCTVVPLIDIFVVR